MTRKQAFHREKELFIAVCELLPEERALYLDEACGNDVELRRRVEDLLRTEEFSVLNDPTVRLLDPQSAKRDRIAGYHLLVKIGDGGMGEVWEAEQGGPIKRPVAVKLIKWGMDSGQVLARFESERQSLALMDHPCIAKVLEAGSTENGRPYFAMELVRGMPITEFCDVHRLNVRDRLELFVDVCAGVQHAHQRGVIHRDLKPANILVADSTEGPVPKIIDFGIAKAIEQRLTEHSIFTELGQWVGTPEYMSPEQTTIPAQDVDTRADVYSLGVILYELLTGTQPIRQHELREAGFDEMRRKIREIEPHRPSARARPVDGDSDTIADRRNTTAVGLERSLRGDLDWLTMKALEKDRERRYASPSELSADIVRHLDGEPVSAGPPGGTYRAMKFIRRHRLGVAAAVFSISALVAGLALATIGLVSAKKSEREAIAQAQSARRVSAVLEEIFNLIEPGSPVGQVGLSREILQLGAERIADSLREDPETRSRLESTIGRVGTSLGYHEMAGPLLDKALSTQRQTLGDSHPDVARTLFAIGWWSFWQGDHDRSRRCFEEAAIISEMTSNRADRLALSARTAEAMIMMITGDREGARRILDRTLRIIEESYGPEDHLVSDVLLHSANLHLDAGESAEAAREIERALDIRREVWGTDHQQYAFAITTMAGLRLAEGRLDEAEQLANSAITIFERTYGPDNPALAASIELRGRVLIASGRWEEAVRDFEWCASILKRQPKPDHRSLARVLRHLVQAHIQQERFEEAGSVARDALGALELALGHNNIECARFLSLIGYIELRLLHLTEAHAAYERAASICLEIGGPNHPGLATVYYNLACTSAIAGDVDGSLNELRRSLDAGFAGAVIFDDPDLASLRGRPEFEAIVAEVRRRIPRS